ncbi:unnamed protein product, partial [Mesorhabditis belari]|uniref:ACB domain-containing protein n=1 Tax=Mesorhabditis belari TaxID=2138241 RepID=A0AAF3EBF5_9BILA
MDNEFVSAVNTWKTLRARFDQRKGLKYEFELFVLFEEETLPIWGLYQQSIVGDINVPKKDYHDPEEESWMWGWMKGNDKWHAWNQCWGMTKEEAQKELIEQVKSLEKHLPELIEKWKDEQDPRIPDQKAWVPEEDRAHWAEVTAKARKERRERSAAQRAHEEKLGMWK